MVNMSDYAKISDVSHNILSNEGEIRESRLCFLYIHPTNFLLFGQMKKRQIAYFTSAVRCFESLNLKS